MAGWWLAQAQAYTAVAAFSDHGRLRVMKITSKRPHPSNTEFLSIVHLNHQFDTAVAATRILRINSVIKAKGSSDGRCSVTSLLNRNRRWWRAASQCLSLHGLFANPDE
ncbi:hypothetical protein BDV18DRAFT_137849 [Aspergillus unguis]